MQHKYFRLAKSFIPKTTTYEWNCICAHIACTQGLTKNGSPLLIKLLKRGQSMVSDVILNKITVIERCYARIKDVYADDPDNLTDFTKQDSIVLNIQRACEACIDLAMHVSAEKKFGDTPKK